MNRYDVLNRIDNYQYIVDCPVFIVGGNLLKDNETNSVCMNIKLRSISSKTIIAVIISVDCFDIENEQLESVKKYIYQDFHISQGECFGDKNVVPFPDPNTRICRINIKKVIYSDNEYWERKADDKIVALGLQVKISDWSLPKLKPVLYDELKQLNYSRDKAIYIPKKYDDCWVCTCGSINFSNATCSCGIREVELFKVFDEQYLTEKKKEFDKKQNEQRQAQIRQKAERERLKEEERQKQIHIERERLRLEQEEEEERKRKAVKNFTIIVIVIIVIFVFFGIMSSLSSDETTIYEADLSAEILNAAGSSTTYFDNNL